MKILKKITIPIFILSSFSSFAEKIDMNEFLVTPISDTKYFGNIEYLKHGEKLSISNIINSMIDVHVNNNQRFIVNSLTYFPNSELDVVIHFTSDELHNQSMNTNYIEKWIISQKYTVRDCSNAGYKVLKIPAGLQYEGRYICSDKEQGETPVDENTVLKPEDFDNYYCDNTIKDTIAYEYYSLDKIKSYYQKVVKSSYEVAGALDLLICSDTAGCSEDAYLKHIRTMVPGIPKERVNFKMNEKGDIQDYSIFALCAFDPVQQSPSDVTPDDVDCRKVIYHANGKGGSNLEPFTDDVCFKPDDSDQTFKRWCKVNFGDSYYSTDGTNEICNPDNALKKTVETETEKKEYYEDKEYNTTDSSKTVDVSNTETIKTTDKNTGESKITSTTTTTVESKKDVVNNYYNKDENHEKVEKYGETKSWWNKKYEGGLTVLLDKHFKNLDNGDFGKFMKGINPFYNRKDNGHFPILKFDFNYSKNFNFGTYSFDLENIEIGDNKINLIYIIKTLLLLSVSIYAFKQIL